MKNSLLEEIEGLLCRHPEGLSEYQLLKAVEAHPAFSLVSDDGELALFQRHFLLMNALYELQSQLLTGRAMSLRISPLCIQLLPLTEAGRDLQLDEDAALRDYYLDWRNFEATGSDDVRALLNDFWRRFTALDDRPDALAILDLPADASGETIKRRYRELAARHHPDKGGDPAAFTRIRQAYEMLV